ncbi:MAG: pullulanase, partial [Candidatus Marinimicrobia bacterium]|nr:pullulanase [Candidatus Neomarinimicrobiota bacterium]
MKDQKNTPIKVIPFTLEQSKDMVSDKVMGFSSEGSELVFRVFAPRALSVIIAFFKEIESPAIAQYTMTRDEDGVWEYRSEKELWGNYYGYYVKGPKGKGEAFDASVLIADPYAKVVATKNNYKHPALGLILKDDFEWEGDTWVATEDPRDLIIYETHLRDLTAHPSSGVDHPGSYLGLTEKGKAGGLSHLKKIGINAVEFLPLHEFGNIEIPWQIEAEGIVNTWNPYARNHWGYMTSYFFAPENYYASEGTIEANKWNGIQGQQVSELKELVKTLHSENIAVILDVVYNHVSQYDQNPLKYLDKKYYFRLDKKYNYLSVSGCGNDYNTEAP